MVLFTDGNDDDEIDVAADVDASLALDMDEPAVTITFKSGSFDTCDLDKINGEAVVTLGRSDEVGDGDEGDADALAAARVRAG